MTTFKRSATATLIAAAAVATTGLVTASPASAASYHCTSSSKSIDMPQYSGPWPDNFDFTVKNCAKRSGSYVSAYSKISWDAPTTAGQVNTFDAAYFRLYLKKSVSGSDPVLRHKDSGLRSKLEAGDGSYTTSTVKYKVGRSKGVGDGTLRLNWNNDGADYKTYKFKVSPRV